VLQLSKPLEGTSDDYNFGMSHIHEWVSDTLEFVSEHPDAEYVNPVAEEVGS
jgi:hypothetical protein